MLNLSVRTQSRLGTRDFIVEIASVRIRSRMPGSNSLQDQ